MVSASNTLKISIDKGDVAAVRAALQADPSLANREIRWQLNQENRSDPLHYVADAVFNGWLGNSAEADIAKALLEHGAAIDGSHGRESPLIGAVSLGAERVARVLIEAGADLECRSVFGARALHWAAWIGLQSLVVRLLEQGAALEARCTEFGATPLFWAVHGYGPSGHRNKSGQLAAAGVLIKAGAAVATSNLEGLSALELARQAADDRMYRLLQSAAESGA
jgi:ankyrin repeat protein